MQDNLPLVSIGLPIFNRPEGLIRTLECLVNQTYQNFEIIIADNCSPNLDVERISREYLEKDNRISYYRHDSNKGWGFNTNFVIEKANGDYFMRATDDDFWDETYVEKIIQRMIINPNSSMGFCNFIEVDVKGEKSRQHLENHLPLLQAFTSSNKIQNIKNYINQFEGYGKSCLYFSIFKTDLLRSDFVKRTLENQILAGDLLINLYCLLRGDLVIVPETLMKVSFGNEKQYEIHESKSKIADFLLITIDYKKFISVKDKWQKYFSHQFPLISNSSFSSLDKIKIKGSILRRILLFYYDLICSNIRIRYLPIFKKIQRKTFLE